MGTPVNIIVGSQVWSEDPEVAWIDGEVTHINGTIATVVTSDGKTIQAAVSSIFPKDTEAPPAGVDDMTKLSYLHEPGVLQNLASRFSLNEIYTYTGNILIAVNPFRRLPHLYDVQMMEQYKGAAFGDLSPHLFAVADACYRAMIKEHGSQSILVSGESGAGKTETTKMLMRYLAFMGGRAATDERSVEQKVLESNPVLEAFGNSKTVKNNNSRCITLLNDSTSRFGKFVEIQFDKKGKISGAAIRTYLLERSRVCQISDPERNYHIFYMLCAAPPEDVKKFKLGDPRKFSYLNKSSCYEVPYVNDAKEYLETRNAMDVVGITSDEQEAIFRVVAAILHLGNIEFIKGKEVDSSQLKDENSVYHLQTAAELLKSSATLLENSLCRRVIVTPDGKITKPLDPAAAALSRDALAKTVYSRLFDWLVDKINSSIGQDRNATNLIGVLDIYGFESFKINSFEQLCINLTNEKLQQHFNQHVFKMEQEDYTKEEINWSYVEFVDNQDVLDLIEKKPGGIIALLDEACMFPRSNHETFAQKLYQTYKAHKRFSKPKLARTAFTINHYAGDVTYQADYFLDKNKDYVVAEHQALLDASECPFVANLFPRLNEDSSKQSKFKSLGTRFKQQLQSLMETLSTTEPHYIRCVKPNTVLKPGIFENFNVLNQLRCGGVLEAIRISCAGYPTKKTFYEFLERFGMLYPDVCDGCDEKTACAAICEKLGLIGYQIGKTKVFLRAGQMAQLDARRTEILGNAARRIQRQIRTYLIRKEYIDMRTAAIHMQTNWRAHLARKQYEQMRREAASISVQKHARAYQARKSYTKLQAATLVIQTGIRATEARSKLRHRRRTRAAIIIQTEWRRHRALKTYLQKKRVTLALQCLWRGKLGRKELKKLKMAARETGALKEAKDKLEKRVEELMWRLELEKQARIDLEDAKGQEIAKLLTHLDELQAQLKEAHEAIVREREEAKIAIAQAPPVIKEVPVVDESNLELLRNQNKELESEVAELRNTLGEFEERYNEVEKQSHLRLKEAEEAHTESLQLKEIVQRLQSILSSLESESQVLRQQALTSTSNEDLSEEVESLKSKIAELEAEREFMRLKATAVHKNTPNQTPSEYSQDIISSETTPDENSTEAKIVDSGHLLIVQQKDEKDFDTPKETMPRANLLMKQRSLTDRQHENLDVLIKFFVEDKQFQKNRPVAPCIVFRTLIYWRSFETERTPIFDKIIYAIRSTIEVQSKISDLAYWLSSISTLLFLVQSTLKANIMPVMASQRNRSSPTTLFGRLAQEFRSSPPGTRISNGYSGMVGKHRTHSKVDAKFPALLFKQHLTAYVEKIYGMVRDNLKKEISPFLIMCIQAPRSTRLRFMRGSSKPLPLSIAAKQNASSKHWQSIVNSLEYALSILKENHVPALITSSIFSQIFSFINVQLFNSLLLRRESCSFSNGEYLKAGLLELDQWCAKATMEYVGSSRNNLLHIHEAVGFLVLHQKAHLSLDEITNELCQMLSLPQIYRIGTMFCDDKYGTHGLSPEVISKIRTLMAEDAGSLPNNSFLIDADSSIPFSMEEVSQTLVGISLSEVEPPEPLTQRSDFHFLLQTSDSD